MLWKQSVKANVSPVAFNVIYDSIMMMMLMEVVKRNTIKVTKMI